jgi:hypothetical protein
VVVETHDSAFIDDPRSVDGGGAARRAAILAIGRAFGAWIAWTTGRWPTSASAARRRARRCRPR